MEVKLKNLRTGLAEPSAHFSTARKIELFLLYLSSFCFLSLSQFPTYSSLPFGSFLALNSRLSTYSWEMSGEDEISFTMIVIIDLKSHTSFFGSSW